MVLPGKLVLSCDFFGVRATVEPRQFVTFSCVGVSDFLFSPFEPRGSYTICWSSKPVPVDQTFEGPDHLKIGTRLPTADFTFPVD